MNPSKGGVSPPFPPPKPPIPPDPNPSSSSPVPGSLDPLNVSPNCLGTSFTRNPLPPPDGDSITRGHFENQRASLSKSLENPPNTEHSSQVSLPHHPRIGKPSYRSSPYGRSKCTGAIRGKGLGSKRSENGPNRYSPLLSELKVDEFVQNTTRLEECRMGVDNSIALGLNPAKEGAADNGVSKPSPAVESTVIDTEMEGSNQSSRPAEFQVTDSAYGMFSPRKDRNDVQSIIWDSTNGHFSLSDSNLGKDKGTTESDLTPPTETLQGATSVWNSPMSGLESFADKIKRSNDIEGLKLEYFPPSVSPDGGCRILITPNDPKISAQCPNKPKPMEESVCVPCPDKALVTGKEPSASGLFKSPVVGSPGAPTRDSEGFTMVQRRKKKGPIKIQSKKQKPVVIRAAHVQYKSAPTSHVQAQMGSGRNASDKPSAAHLSGVKKGAANDTCDSSIGGNVPFKGFNFSRAVNGNGGKISVRNDPSTIATMSPKPIPQDSSNRFSVLDIPNSIKCNRLVADSSDLYPHGMDDDGTENMEVTHFAPKENLICQVNREYIEGVRILPASILSPPKPSHCKPVNDICMHDPEIQEKDYGITDAQKNAIYNSLCGPSKAVRAVDMAEWEPGQHEYFEDQVKLLNMDMDFCVEDVESDEESGTAQFFSGMLKSGVPKAPVSTMLSPTK
ncbi:hypothetical protein L1987_14065 [Smallanthus sonchifolius]|uniref:Uncharacterized protein n=1 Tax=Smallanthus sonchifolius TaxID=185202 RepID=A0ACB9J2B3_9ASTR|nr:hypothetical protein L1987_14065 [Smallanthus sonchifolius]